MADYPFPWRSVHRFFNAMPESILGTPAPITAPEFDPQTHFDLVVIAYPVWFLAPAPPIQAFFKSPHVAVLRGANVVTISVSRAMWQRASEAMKVLLAHVGAIHCDNVVVTHHGSPLLTLISTPRALLYGKRDRLLSFFPRAGVSAGDLARVGNLGLVVARRLREERSSGVPFLEGEPAVAVNRWFIVPELVAWHCFWGWAVMIQALGRRENRLRVAGIYGFAFFLVGLIVLGLPISLLATWLAYPAIKNRLNAHAARLAMPTGECA